MASFSEIGEYLGTGVDDGFVGDIADGDSIDIVCVVVVCDEVILISVDGDGWKRTGCIGVEGTRLFVGQGCVAEDIVGVMAVLRMGDGDCFRAWGTFDGTNGWAVEACVHGCILPYRGLVAGAADAGAWAAHSPFGCRRRWGQVFADKVGFH